MCVYIKSMQNITTQRSTAALSYTTEKPNAQHSRARTTGYHVDEHVLSQNSTTEYNSMRHRAAGRCRAHTCLS